MVENCEQIWFQNATMYQLVSSLITSNSQGKFTHLNMPLPAAKTFQNIFLTDLTKEKGHMGPYLDRCALNKEVWQPRKRCALSLSLLSTVLSRVSKIYGKIEMPKYLTLADDSNSNDLAKTKQESAPSSVWYTLDKLHPVFPHFYISLFAFPPDQEFIMVSVPWCSLLCIKTGKGTLFYFLLLTVECDPEDVKQLVGFSIGMTF